MSGLRGRRALLTVRGRAVAALLDQRECAVAPERAEPSGEARIVGRDAV